MNMTHVILFTDGPTNVTTTVACFYAPTKDTAQKITRAYVKSATAGRKDSAGNKLTKRCFKLFSMDQLFPKGKPKK